MMQKVSGDVVKKKIAQARANRAGAPGADSAFGALASEIGAILTAHFNVKTSANLVRVEDDLFGHLIKSCAKDRRAYFFRAGENGDYLVFLDAAAIFVAASWAHERALLKEPDASAKPTFIDQRLAEPLARAILSPFVNGPEGSRKGREDRALELAAIGDDPRQFVLKDELAAAKLFSFAPETVNGERLGAIAVLAPAASVCADESRETQSADPERQHWAAGLARAASGAPIPARVVIARQTLGLAQVASWKPGHIISLKEASLNAAGLECGDPDQAVMLGMGAVRSVNGRRALKVARLRAAERPEAE